MGQGLGIENKDKFLIFYSGARVYKNARAIIIVFRSVIL